MVHKQRLTECYLFNTDFKVHTAIYCKFARLLFREFFYFRIISDFLNSRASMHSFYKVYNDSLLVGTLNSRGNQFTNISENKFSEMFPDLQYFKAKT